MEPDQPVKKTYSLNTMVRFIAYGIAASVLGLIFSLVWVFFLFDEQGKLQYTSQVWWILPGIGMVIGGIIWVITMMRRLLRPSLEEQALLPANFSTHSKEDITKLIKPVKIGMYVFLGIIACFVIILMVMRSA